MDTRRSFIVQAAALAASPLIGTRMSRAFGASPKRQLGFALCGLGNLSTHQIAPALQKTANCRLVGIITGTPAKAVQWQARYGIPERNVYSYETMEISVARCRQMIEAVKAANRVLGIGYRCRFEPHHLECLRIAREGEFGPLKLIDAHFGNRVDAGVWRLKRALAGGGPLMDVGIYALQATRYLTGEEPVWISAATTQGDPARFSEVEESVVWEAKFPGGAVTHCGSSYNTPDVGYFRAIAERGWFGLEPAFNYDGTRGMRSDGRPIEFAPTDQFAVEMDDFAGCILEGKATRVPGEEGLRDVSLMMSIYTSARTGRPIDLRSG
jgi:predicted dehydrogenase